MAHKKWKQLDCERASNPFGNNVKWAHAVVRSGQFILQLTRADKYVHRCTENVVPRLSVTAGNRPVRRAEDKTRHRQQDTPTAPSGACDVSGHMRKKALSSCSGTTCARTLSRGYLQTTINAAFGHEATGSSCGRRLSGTQWSVSGFSGLLCGVLG